MSHDFDKRDEVVNDVFWKLTRRNVGNPAQMLSIQSAPRNTSRTCLSSPS